jgi:hypothetical protein
LLDPTRHPRDRRIDFHRCFWRKADINQQFAAAKSVANDPKRGSGLKLPTLQSASAKRINLEVADFIASHDKPLRLHHYHCATDKALFIWK